MLLSPMDCGHWKKRGKLARWMCECLSSFSHLFPPVAWNSILISGASQPCVCSSLNLSASFAVIVSIPNGFWSSHEAEIRYMLLPNLSMGNRKITQFPVHNKLQISWIMPIVPDVPFHKGDYILKSISHLAKCHTIY